MGRQRGKNLTSLVWAMIGVLGLAAMGLLGANAWRVAQDIDERTLERQSQAVQHGLRLLGEFASGELLSYTQWDEAVTAIIDEKSMSWMKAKIGTDIFSPDERRVYVLTDDGISFASDIDGKPDAAAAEPILKAVERVAKRAGDLYEKAIAEDLYLDDRYGDGFYYGIYAYEIASVNGVPSVVVAAPLVGETDETDVPDRAVHLIDIQPLAGEVIDRLRALSQIDGLEVHGIEGELEGPYVALYDGAGNTIGRMTFEQVTPGAEIIRSAGPMMGLSLLAFMGLTFIVTRVISRKTRALAASEEAALHASRHDPATRLANRGWYLVELERLTKDATKQSAPGVILIDCDYFKQINDTLGHAAGDAVLLVIADRLRSLSETLLLAARFGGDEFAAVTVNVSSDDNLSTQVDRITTTLTQPVYFKGDAIPVTVSVGAARVWQGEDPQSMLARADIALYRAKRDGRACARIYDPALDIVTAPAPSIIRKGSRDAA